MVVGSVHAVGKDLYVIVNKQGTIEKLPRIGSWWVLCLFFLQAFGKVKSLPEVRAYVRKHSKW